MASGRSNSESSQQAKTKSQEKALNKMLKLYMPQAGQNNKVWQGDRVADFNDLQTSALDQVGNFADIFSDTKTTPDTPLFGETGNALNDILSGNTGAQKTTPEQIDQYFTDSIKNPSIRTFNETVLPTIDDSYAGGNFWSAARGNARSKAATDLSNELITQRSQLDWDVNQANQALDEAKAGRTLQAVPQAMQYSQMPTQQIMSNLQIASDKVAGLGSIFGFGKEQQTQDQSQLQAEMLKFAEENQITDPNDLSVIMGLLDMNFSKGSSDASSRNCGMM